MDAFSHSISRSTFRPSQIILKASSLQDDDTSRFRHQLSSVVPPGLFDPFDIQHTGTFSTPARSSSGDTEHWIISAERRKDLTPPAKSNLLSLQLSDVWKARLLLILAAALYGTNFTCVKMLDETVPVGISTTLRFALASIATLPWLVGRSDNQSEHDATVVKDTMPTSLAAAIAGLEVGAWNSIAYISQAVGLESSDASKSAFICSLSVVVVPFLGETQLSFLAILVLAFFWALLSKSGNPHRALTIDFLSFLSKISPRLSGGKETSSSGNYRCRHGCGGSWISRTLWFVHGFDLVWRHDNYAPANFLRNCLLADGESHGEISSGSKAVDRIPNFGRILIERGIWSSIFWGPRQFSASFGLGV